MSMFTRTHTQRHAEHSIAMCVFVPKHRRAADWLALALLMSAAGFVFFWNLTASGYANEFYSAAAQAASKSWSAFLWGSLDAGGAITVDKPPASIWIMALSVRLFGLSSFAILAPQALMGVASTYLLYAICRRYWGNAAGIVAGAVFITTPVAALMFRFNNPDALLVLLQIAAAGLTLRALELPDDRHGNQRRGALVICAGLLVGLGFLTKQLQVLLVVPGFGIALLVFSPTRMRRRFLDAALAIASIFLGAGWWVLLTVIVPAGSRPYIGGSQTDSFIELTFSYNGLGRLTGDETGSVVPGGGNASGGMWGETGLLRLFGGDFGDQITWLALFAFVGIAAGVVAAVRMRHTNKQPGAQTASLVRMRAAGITVFGLWLVITWLVFSFMAGIFHQYYTVALTPAVAVLVAICLRSLFELRKHTMAQVTFALLTLFSGIWAFALIWRYSAWRWLGIIVLCTTATASVIWCICLCWRSLGGKRSGRNIMRACVILQCVALMAGPIVWTACTIATGHQGSIVTAGPSSSMDTAPQGQGGGMNDSQGGGMGGGPSGSTDGNPSGNPENGNSSGTDSTDASDGAGSISGGITNSGGNLLGGSTASTSLIELLTQNASGYRWAAATTGSQNAASYQLATELPIMAIGGFNGSDPSPTLKQFKSYVKQGLIRYYIASGGMGGQQMGGSDSASKIAAWVAKNFSAQTIGGVTVYDLQS